MTSVHPSGQSAPVRPTRTWHRVAFLAALAVLTALLVDVGTALAQTPDLTAEKINDVGGVIGPGDPFTWTITVENQGTADAVIRAGAMLVSDALPSGPIYGPLAVNTTGVENLAALDCKTSALVISCRAVGDAITMTVGSSVQVSLPVTPTTTGDLVNPAAPGVCRADPTNFVAESNENNNNCADTVSVQRADLVVVKQNNTGDSVPLTDSFKWTWAIANTGAGPAYFPDDSIIVWDELPAAATYAQPTLTQLAGITAGQLTCAVQAKVLSCRAVGPVTLPAAGGGFSLELLVTPTAAGDLTNLATACSVDVADVVDESNEANNSCSDTVTVTGIDLRVQKLSAAGLVNPGDTIVYTLAYENRGALAATGVTISETVPAGTVYVAAGSAAWSCADGAPAATTCQLDVGVLASNADDTAAFSVRVLDPLPTVLAAIVNTVTIADDGANGLDSRPADNRDTVSLTVGAFPKIVVEQRAALIDDADGDTVPSPGDKLRYTLHIENQGKVPATLVELTNAPGSTAPLVVGTVTTSAGAIVAGNTVGDTAVGVDLGTMAAGAQVDVTFDVVIVAPLPIGVVQISSQSSVTGGNFAQVFSDDPDTAAPSDPTVTPLTAQPDIHATLVANLAVDADQDGSPSPGDQLRYTVTITNAGKRNASGVNFVDIPDPNTTLVPGSVAVDGGRGVVTKGNEAGDANVAVTIGALDGLGDSVTFVFDVTIHMPLPATVNNVVRQGIVGSDQLPNVLSDDPALPGAEDATITPISAAAVLVAELRDVLADDADGNGEATPGDTLEYVAVIRNRGNKGALGVMYRNALPAEVLRTDTPVATSQGTVTGGNDAADRTVVVDVGGIEAGATAEIRYRVTIAAALPVTTQSITNQGVVQATGGDDVNTDDPDTPAAADPTITPIRADVVIYTTLRDYLWSDADNNRRISPGDILLYRLDLYNFGLRTAGEARISLSESPRLTLVSGTVQSSAGTVAVGNAPGDSRISIEFDAIAPNAHVVVTFRTQVGDVTGLQSIAMQTWTRYLAPDDSVFTVFSDDPDTALIGDPTVSALFTTEPPVVSYLPLVWTARGD